MSGIILAMTFGSGPQTLYRVSTTIYEGPLDLLLQLIEKAELDITKLALAQVTDQYLAHMQNLSENVSPDEVSAFLVVAARLLQIKSEMLLPRPPILLPDEDQGEALARQLILYRRFKELAKMLEQRETANLKTFIRLGSTFRNEGSIEIEGLSLDQLLEAAGSVFSQDERLPLTSVVPAYRVTIREKIHLIANILFTEHLLKFSSLVHDRPNRLEIVVTFLALLELIKRRMVSIHQEQLFADIEIERSETWDANDENFELEFGE
jgi:segregation and condensation protein A